MFTDCVHRQWSSEGFLSPWDIRDIWLLVIFMENVKRSHYSDMKVGHFSRSLQR